MWALGEWNQTRARAVVKRVVQRKAALFAPYADYGLDDLESEAMLAACNAWPSYDATKSAESTFIYMTAARRLLDLLRHLQRRSARENPQQGQLIQDFEGSACDEEGLVEWLEEAYHKIKASFTNYGMPLRAQRGTRACPNRAQATVLLALKNRLGYSTRQMAALLKRRPELLKLIGVTQSPSHEFFYRVERAVTQFNFFSRPS